MAEENVSYEENNSCHSSLSDESNVDTEVEYDYGNNVNSTP